MDQGIAYADAHGITEVGIAMRKNLLMDLLVLGETDELLAVAEQLGRLVGAGGVAVTAWGIAKWPVLALVVALMLAILYWATPNARQGWRWVSPGGLVALVIWIVASVGFGLYVAHFGSYNKTYGALGAVIIFLVWLWLSNLAILFGAEFDAELERSRAIATGHPADREPYVEMRDAPKKPTADPDLA